MRIIWWAVGAKAWLKLEIAMGREELEKASTNNVLEDGATKEYKEIVWQLAKEAGWREGAFVSYFRWEQ